MNEAKELMVGAGFEELKASTRFGSGDLLMIKPSEKYDSPFFKLIRRIYPRWLVRLFGDRYVNLLIEAARPLEINATRDGGS